MKLAVQPYGYTSQVPALTTEVAGVGEFGSMPGQTSVALGPAEGFALPLVPDLLTCFLKVGVNHLGCAVRSVVAAVADPAPTSSARTATPAAMEVRFMTGRVPVHVPLDTLCVDQ